MSASIQNSNDYEVNDALHRTTVNKENQRSLQVANDLEVITIDKDFYRVPEQIQIMPWLNEAYLSIIRTSSMSDLNSDNIRFFVNFGSVNGSKTMILDWIEILGASGRPQTWRTSTNVSTMNLSSLGPFSVIRTDSTRTKVIGKSIPFTIGPPEDILILKDTYYPGESFFLNTTNIAIESSAYGIDYYKIFTVPYSYKNDPTQFNNAPFRVYDVGQSVIDFNQPGKYQLVTFLNGGLEIIKGISNVFEVISDDGTNELENITIDKDFYRVSEQIKIMPWLNEAYLSIIRTSSISNLSSDDIRYFVNFGSVDGSKTMILDWIEILGTRPQTWLTSTNVNTMNLSSLGPFSVIRTDSTRTKVIGKSIPFTIGPPEDILVLKDTYYPGEFFFLNTTNIAIENTAYGNDYYKIFTVPYSYKNDPTQFNNAPFRFYEVSQSVIDFNKPGKYQLVTFLNGGLEIIKGISNVFEVIPNDASSRPVVTINSTSFFPGQGLILNVTRLVATPFNQIITFNLVPANTTRTGYYTNLKGFNKVIWDSSSTTMSFHLRFKYLQARSGAFKIGILLEETYLLAVSPVFQIKRPLIEIKMHKRSYYQGERAALNVYMPYFTLEEFHNIYGDGFNNGYVFAITPTNISDSTVIRNIDPRNTILYTFKPGFFKFVLYRFENDLGDQVFMPISNSTFRVLSNPGILSSDKSRYKKGDILKLTLSSVANISLCGQFPGYIISESVSRYVRFTYDNYDFGLDGNCIAPTSIMTETLIDWTPEGNGDTKVEIKLGTSDIIFATTSFRIRK
jgi:hypothetical protein